MSSDCSDCIGCISKEKYENYIAILEEELILAVGCTEPACLALAGAKLREVLGEIPERIVLKMSGNLIKNAKSVTIPYSNGLKGIPAAIWLGILGGTVESGLAVLDSVTTDDIEETKCRIAQRLLCQIELLDTPAKLHLIVEGSAGQNKALVEILHTHTNFVRIEKNNQVLLNKDISAKDSEEVTDRSLLNIKDILLFADTVNLQDVKAILKRQIDYNIAIAEAGLADDYGANIGTILIKNFGNSVGNIARATTAAACDARMGGCQLPVVINSGSGNQGIAASVPVVVYARENDIPEDRLLRALCVSNLIGIHQKTGIGRLSAYCGGVSAACASGAAITYMLGGDYEQVSDTITNTLVNVSGILCDGAKPSCAAKIASSVDAAILGVTMSFDATKFCDGDGIVKSNVEETIDVIGNIAAIGMKDTDVVVIKHLIQ